MNSKTFYNPETNQIRSVIHWSKWFDPQNLRNKGFVNLGYKKVAEAFTSVTPEERIMLWKALDQERTYSFDFSMLNSKVRHKLKRLGLRQLGDCYLSEGERLLRKINKKKR